MLFLKKLFTGILSQFVSVHPDGISDTESHVSVQGRVTLQPRGWSEDQRRNEIESYQKLFNLKT
jgi:hypothetical protein